jgi:RNA polymerase sigma factor (sigma-70 family)
MWDLQKQMRRIEQLLRLRGTKQQDAEDLVQEAVLRLHVYTRSGRDVRDPTGFLIRAVRNLTIDARRRAHGELYVATPVEELELIDLSPGPEEAVAAQERLIRMKNALDQVSVRTRAVFFMHRLQGLSHGEIAARLGVTKSAVEKHIASAVTILAMERQRE